ncbi:trafficking regulator of GLUT4 (SLC2A4) 1b [Hoplias malabaricus]|uniref:trafficking regulator of GLUT4 (SLC2A4) 1b n=1 Tax=Hoplias malabaricus TaxID=27720 RepID=UPI0034622B2F
MAVNTDAAMDAVALRESAVPQAGDFGDTQKLLGVSAEGLGISEARRGSVQSLNAEQNGRRSSFKSGSAGNITARELSVLSASRASSPGFTEDTREAPNFMWLAVVSCFCPAIPFNLLALYFAYASHSMPQAEYEAAKRLGRRSLVFSVISIMLGVALILYLAITES